MKLRHQLLCTAAASVALQFLAAPSAVLAQARAKDAAVAVTSLRSEYTANPLGLDVRRPRLFWQLQSGARGVVQSAYQVRVAASEGGLRAGRDLV